MDSIHNYIVVPGADWSVRDIRKGGVSFGGAVAAAYDKLREDVG